MNDFQGWLNIYKPKNLSSFSALNLIKKNFDIGKIGHAGTLDPLAEGILPIAIGSSTKLIPYITENLKVYRFTVSWGSQTSTDDAEGEVLYKSDVLPNYNDILSKSINFIGTHLQRPPNVSAIKIHGKRAYKLFREKKEFSIKPRKVFMKNCKILSHESCKTYFEIECGKGFYIRSFARDLAIQLGTFGHISSLKRLKVGKFNTENSILLDDLIKISNRQKIINYIHPSISMLDDILACEIENEDDLTNLSFGRSILIDENKLLQNSSTKLDEKLFFLSNNGDIVSIGKLIGNLFKPNKVLIMEKRCR